MIRTARPVAVIAALTVAVLSGSCSDDDPESGPATSRDTTTTTRPAPPAPYAERGDHDVGTFTLALADGRRVVVWYPADPEATEDQPEQSFDLASLLRPDLQAMIPAELRVPYAIDAHPGAEPAAGRFPVVLFSHGFAGFPEQSVDLTTHLASWGFVVAAPDHVERSLSGLLGTAAQGVERREDTDVLAETLDLVQAEDARSGSPLAGNVDADRVAVTGHSAGAGAAYRFATADDRVDAFVAYSIGQRDEDEAPPVPEVPGMVMLGTDDGIIPAAASRAVFEAMERPRYRVEIGGAGHLVFSDICLIGAEKGGVIAIADEVGLPIDQFRELGTDGCTDEHPPVADAFPAIDDLSVDFLRTALGLQDEPAGLDDPTISGAFDAEIEVTAEP